MFNPHIAANFFKGYIVKELYLLILNNHKRKIYLFFSLLSLFGIAIQFYANSLNMASLLTICLAYIYCMYVWMNGTFTFAAPLDERSNSSDVFWRWIMILISFLLLIYAVLAPIYSW